MNVFSKLFSSSPSMPDGAVEFLQRLEDWRHDLAFASVRGVAMRGPDGALWLSNGKIDLLPIDSGLPDMCTETEHLLAFRSCLTTASAITIIEHACKSGTLEVPGFPPIILFVSPKHVWARFQDHWSGLKQHFPRDLSLSISLGEIDHRFTPGTAPVNFTLRSLDKPFNDLNDLCAKYELPPVKVAGEFEVCAHSPVCFVQASGRLDAGTLSVSVKTNPVLDTGKVSVSYLATDSMDAGPLGFAERTGTDLTFIASNLKGGKYRLLLNYSGQNVDEAIVIDPLRFVSPLATALTTFDPGLEIVRSYIEGKGKGDSKDFEAGIATLFALLGFTVVPLHTIKKLTNGPDTIVFSSARHVGVIECTLFDLNNKDKLSKLVLRTDQIRSQLHAAGMRELTILPVIVSPLPMSELQGDLAKASQSKVYVLDRARLNDLFERARFHPDPDSIFAEMVEQATA